MAKKSTRPSKRILKRATETEVPPGATRKALDRPIDPGGGPAGSGAGPRHASGDTGSETEAFEASEATTSPASPPIDQEDWLEKGPPFSGPSGGAVGGTPAQGRSSEGSTRQRLSLDEESENIAEPTTARSVPEPKPELNALRLTGFEAIEYAEKQNRLLNKHPDAITGPRTGLSIGEASAIADEDPDLIWLDVWKEEYYEGPPTSFEPER